MEVLLSLIALAIAFAGGLGLVLFLSPVKSRGGWCELSGTAILVGAGVVSLLSFCLGFILHGALLRWTTTAVCAALLFLGWRKHRGTLLATTRPKPPLDVAQVIVAAVVVLQVGFVTWLSLYCFHLGWDGLFNWESKARLAFYNQGALPLEFYSTGVDFFHKGYPLFFPLAQAWIYSWLGQIDQSLIKLIGPYFYLASLLLAIAFARNVSGSRWTGLFAVLLFGSVPALIAGEGSASSGYADFPLAAMSLCAAVHSAGYWRTGSPAAVRLTGVSAMFLPFIKTEGYIALLCIALAVAPKVLRDRNWKAGFWMIAPGLATWFGWAAFLRLTHSYPEHDFRPLTVANFLTGLPRVPNLLRWTWQALTAWNFWSLLWPASIGALVIAAARGRAAQWYPWAVNILVPLIAFPATYIFSGWDPVEPHFKSSLWRLWIHSAPAAVVVTAVVLGEFVKARPLPAAHRRVDVCASR